MVFIATLIATGVLFVIIPKGFFPQQDTGFISGFAESAQDASFASMNRRMLELADVVRADPDVTGFGMNGSSSTYNTGNFFISLRPLDEGRTATADDIIARLRPKLAKIEGANLFLQAGQDIRVGGRLSRTQYQYTTPTEPDELTEWALLMARFAGPAAARRCERPAELGPRRDADCDRASSTASRGADRRDDLRRDRPAPGGAVLHAINSYHVVLEVTPAAARPRPFSKLT
jgi:HAE1 family hydrophobic/amphiphilic exporter-1